MNHAHSREMQFDHDWYRGFLASLLDADRRFRSFGEGVDRGDVLLRHDVDLSVSDARAMARIEAEAGVESTYFVLVSSPLYNPLDGATAEAIREIESLGHDVGLHFSTHAYWPADDPPSESALRARVRAEQRLLDGVVSDLVDTVSFHIPPEWTLGRAFETLSTAYEPAYFEEIDYTSDSRQRWRDDPPLTDGVPDRLQILTHPGLWGDRDRTFAECVERAAEEAERRASEYATTEFLADSQNEP